MNGAALCGDVRGDSNSQNSRDSQPLAFQNGEPPRPLQRETSPAQPFPLEALGDVLGGAAYAILDKVRCPDAIAANSVLAAASLAVQAHADVVLPATGHPRPLSLFLATVASSGERKSVADYEASRPVRRHEEALREVYEAALPDYRLSHRAWEIAAREAEKTKGGRLAKEAALKAIGPEPQPPLLPMLTCGEPTLEGLHKLFAGGQPTLGIFSDEGGAFISGHAMAVETRLKTVAGLSTLWDGAPIKRVRAVDGADILPGRRLAFHIMAQPDAAARMLSDQVLVDQGFLSRLLVAAPTSTAGTRFQRPLAPETEPALRRYDARLLAILRTPPILLAKTRNALDPRRLELAPEAARRWLAFADDIERLLGAGKALEPVRGFANKLPEHAARVAGVLTLIEDLGAIAISCRTLDQAIRILDFYTSEALRLFEAASCPPELRHAEKLLEWLKAWPEPLVGLSVIYRLGPNSIREAETAKKAVKLLEEHGWLLREPGRQIVSGSPVPEAWRIVREV